MAIPGEPRVSFSRDDCGELLRDWLFEKLLSLLLAGNKSIFNFIYV